MAFSLKVSDIDISYERDELLECTIIYIIRQRGTKTQKIGVQLSAGQKILSMGDNLKSIIEKYSDGTVNFTKMFPVESDIWLKLSTCGTSMYVDIRRYIEIEEVRYPLKAGVAIPASVFPTFVDGLQDLIEEAQS